MSDDKKDDIEKPLDAARKIVYAEPYFRDQRHKEADDNFLIIYNIVLDYYDKHNPPPREEKDLQKHMEYRKSVIERIEDHYERINFL